MRLDRCGICGDVVLGPGVLIPGSDPGALGQDARDWGRGQVKGAIETQGSVVLLTAQGVYSESALAISGLATTICRCILEYSSTANSFN
jgi:hypothetical protein